MTQLYSPFFGKLSLNNFMSRSLAQAERFENDHGPSAPSSAIWRCKKMAAGFLGARIKDLSSLLRSDDLGVAHEAARIQRIFSIKQEELLEPWTQMPFTRNNAGQFRCEDVCTEIEGILGALTDPENALGPVMDGEWWEDQYSQRHVEKTHPSFSWQWHLAVELQNSIKENVLSYKEALGMRLAMGAIYQQKLLAYPLWARVRNYLSRVCVARFGKSQPAATFNNKFWKLRDFAVRPKTNERRLWNRYVNETMAAEKTTNEPSLMTNDQEARLGIDNIIQTLINESEMKQESREDVFAVMYEEIARFEPTDPRLTYHSDDTDDLYDDRTDARKVQVFHCDPVDVYSLISNSERPQRSNSYRAREQEDIRVIDWSPSLSVKLEELV